MGYPSVRIDGTTVTRAPSEALWRNALDRYADSDQDAGRLLYQDFKNEIYANATDGGAENGWWLQGMAAGGTPTFDTVDGTDGIATLAAVSGTAHFGSELHRGHSATTVGQVLLPQHASGAGDVIFETYVDLDDTELVYVGYTEPIVDFLSATSVLPTNSSYIGLIINVAAGDVHLVADEDVAGAATDLTVLAGASIVAGYNKLGFRVNADNSVEVVINDVNIKRDTSGVLLDIAEANYPVSALTEKFIVGRAAGTNAAVSLPIDWVRSFTGN